jgi:hypothetical protein
MKVTTSQRLLEILIIIAFAIFPLFITFPYRAYLYLSWEGAYRLSEGQIPFRDFGLPVGGMYWVVPAIFFKILGPQLITLVKAQVFINILSGLAVRSILKTLPVSSVIRIAGIFLYCLSFSFQNFWPWYNHTVIVYAFIAVAFVLKAIFSKGIRLQSVFLILGSLFTFFSVFTKQDGGGLIFILCCFLLVYYCWLERSWLPLTVYIAGTCLFIGTAVLILNKYNFAYWFNYGQSPHNARISYSDIVNDFLNGSIWLKFYLFTILLLVIAKVKDKPWKKLLKDKEYMLFLLFTVGILCMAAILQVTSYIPSIGNMFFHTFAFVFIFQQLTFYLNFTIKKEILIFLLIAGISLWWSQLPWKYVERLFIKKENEGAIALSANGENLVGMHNFILKEKNEEGDQGKWVTSDLYSLKKIKLPEPTVEGINRLMNSDILKTGKSLKVLNMSELTFLAHELPYSLEKNPEAPLWHHLVVGMFNKQLHMYEERIRNNYYDLVLFEYIPDLNNFFPFGVRDALKAYYKQVDVFDAPRSGKRPGTIEIYIKKP